MKKQEKFMKQLRHTVKTVSEMSANNYLYIRLSGKFMQLVSKRICETFGFYHSIEGTFLLRHTNFGPIGSFPS